MTRAEIAQEAEAFLIWREGKSVRWDCTVRELAAATGVPVGRVRKVILDRGWPARGARPGPEPGFNNDLGYLFARNESRFAGGEKPWT